MEGSPEFAAHVVSQFIKSMQPTKFKSKQKQHLKSFSDYYFRQFPDLPHASIRYLLLGDGEKKGLLASCGNTNVKTMNSIKKSSALALGLLWRLMDPMENKTHADKFIAVLPDLTLKQLQSIKMDRHLVSAQGHEHTEISCRLLYLITQQCPNIRMNEYVQTGDAIEQFDRWTEENIESESDSEPEPERWSDIVLEDFEKDLADKDDEFLQDLGNDEHETADPLQLITKVVIREPTTKSSSIWRKLIKKQNKNGGDLSLDSKRGYDPTERFRSSQEGSINTADSNFHPVLFLNAVHRNAELSELETGLDRLNANNNSRANQMRTLVKDHFNEFVYCKDTIDTIHELIQHEVVKEISASANSKTDKLGFILQRIESKSIDLYADTLKREAESSRIRRLLTVLRRFPLLFNVSGRLRENIAAGEYAEVIRDYKKYTQMAHPAPSEDGQGDTIAQKLLANIAQMIEGVREELFAKLEFDPNARMEEQQRVIGYLLELDCKQDPTWYYLLKQRDWIMSSLEKCYLNHMERITPFTQQRERVGAQSSTSTTATTTTTEHKHRHHHRNHHSSESISALLAVDHSTATVVKQLSCTITETMPDFFLLAGDISSGKFSKAAAATSLSNSVYASSGDSENDGQKVTSLLSGIVVGFCKYIRSVVFPRNSKYHRELDSGVSAYMSQKQPQTEEEKKKSRGYHALPASTQGTVNAVLTCYQKIKRLPGFPETCMLSYGRLANDLIAYYTNRIFINGVHAISNLSIKETWRQVPQPKGVTLLPGQFQTHCEKLLVDLECIPDAFWQDPKLLSMIAAPFLECLRAFGDCMHYVGLHTSNLQNHDSALKAQHLDTSAQKLSPFTRDIRAYRLLIVISNIVHTSEVVLPKIWAAFLRRIPRSTDRHLLEDKFQDILDVYEVLESLFVKRYVRVKTMLVGKVIKAGFFKAGTDWASHPTARDLGTGYIQEALMHLVHVHDEVQTVVPDQTGRILDDLTEGVLSTFHQCTIEIKALTTSGAIQLSVQLDFLKETLAAYLSGEAEATIETLEDHFGVIMADLSSGDRKMAVKRSRKILHDVRKITFLLLSCFQEATQAEEDQ